MALSPSVSPELEPGSAPQWKVFLFFRIFTSVLRAAASWLQVLCWERNSWTQGNPFLWFQLWVHAGQRNVWRVLWRWQAFLIFHCPTSSHGLPSIQLHRGTAPRVWLVRSCGYWLPTWWASGRTPSSVFRWWRCRDSRILHHWLSWQSPPGPIWATASPSCLSVRWRWWTICMRKGFAFGGWPQSIRSKKTYPQLLYKLKGNHWDCEGVGVAVAVDEGVACVVFAGVYEAVDGSGLTYEAGVFISCIGCS